MLHTITSDSLKLIFDDEFGEITSITFFDNEIIKKPQSESWKKSWPVMFPICGALFNNQYIHGNQTYDLQRHGFFRSLKWSINKEKSILSARCINASEFKQLYPFNFDIKLIIRLVKNQVHYEVQIANLGNETMYFNVGHHGAFRANNETAEVIFKENTNFQRNLPTRIIQDALNISKIKLGELDFSNEASYQALNIKTKEVILNNGLGQKILFEFNDFSVFLLWRIKNEQWICIEPWNGTQDINVNEPKQIEQKKYIKSLAPLQSEIFKLKLTIEKEN